MGDMQCSSVLTYFVNMYSRANSLMVYFIYYEYCIVLYWIFYCEYAHSRIRSVISFSRFLHKSWNSIGLERSFLRSFLSLWKEGGSALLVKYSWLENIPPPCNHALKIGIFNLKTSETFLDNDFDSYWILSECQTSKSENQKNISTYWQFCSIVIFKASKDLTWVSAGKLGPKMMKNLSQTNVIWEVLLYQEWK